MKFTLLWLPIRPDTGAFRIFHCTTAGLEVILCLQALISASWLGDSGSSQTNLIKIGAASAAQPVTQSI